MKFDNIKPGDEVLAPVTVRYGFGLSKTFNCLRLVERVTPKTFDVNGVKYRRDNGREYAAEGFKRVYKIGSCNPSTGNLLWDQTDECNAFRNRVIKRNQAYNIAKELPKKLTIDCDCEKILSLLREVEQIIGESKQ